MKNYYLLASLAFLLISCGEEQEVKLVKGPIHEQKLDDPALEQGRLVWVGTCKTCHLTGVSGAPILGDKEAWKSRIAKGEAQLIQSAIKGFESDIGNTMPPKGGNPKLKDEEVAAAVRFVIHTSQ